MGGLALGLTICLAVAVGLVATAAVRNRVLLRLGLRNVTRRPGRALLIVTGLMLATTIIASALTTGDTMNRTVRSAVIESLGRTDELVSARGTENDPAQQLGTSSSVDYFPQSLVPAVERALRGTGLVDGVAPAIVEPIAIQDATTRRTEARVSLFATPPASMRGFGTIRDRSGHP